LKAGSSGAQNVNDVKKTNKSIFIIVTLALFLRADVHSTASTIAGYSERLALPWSLSQDHPAGISSQNCKEAAIEALGPTATVLRCGHLTRVDSLEVIAVIQLRQFREARNAVAVSKLVILRKNTSQWETLLTADRQNWIRNNAGYIGVEFIDDSADFVGYRISFSDEGSGDISKFTIWFNYLSPKGQNEGIETGITWNPSVGRFQEFPENQEPEGFQPEIKNPKHIRTRRPPS
jgi:hypothetical protein